MATASLQTMMIKILRHKITRSELKKLAGETFVEMIKAVADIRREVIAVGGELHADAEEKLMGDGSAQQDLWGFNIYLDGSEAEALEYTSLINIRSRDHNPSLEIVRPEIRAKIKELAVKFIDWEQ